MGPREEKKQAKDQVLPEEVKLVLLRIEAHIKKRDDFHARTRQMFDYLAITKELVLVIVAAVFIGQIISGFCCVRLQDSP